MELFPKKRPWWHWKSIGVSLMGFFAMLYLLVLWFFSTDDEELPDQGD